VHYNANGNLLSDSITRLAPGTQGVRGQNRGEEGCSLATPVDLSTVPGLGPRAELQEGAQYKQWVMNLINNITMPKKQGARRKRTRGRGDPPHLKNQKPHNKSQHPKK